MNRFTILLVVLGFLAGCASVPPPSLTADNPASPSAPEATVPPPRNTLLLDNLTKKTREIFAQTGKAQEQPSPTPVQGQEQMNQMPGMKMP